VVDDGHLVGFDLGEIVACHNRISQQMLNAAQSRV